MLPKQPFSDTSPDLFQWFSHFVQSLTLLSQRVSEILDWNWCHVKPLVFDPRMVFLTTSQNGVFNMFPPRIHSKLLVPLLQRLKFRPFESDESRNLLIKRLPPCVLVAKIHGFSVGGTTQWKEPVEAWERMPKQLRDGDYATHNPQKWVLLTDKLTNCRVNNIDLCPGDHLHRKHKAMILWTRCLPLATEIQNSAGRSL